MDENKNILADVQEMIVKRLNEDSALSGNCTFIAENRKTVDFEIKNALGRQGIVGLVLTPTATYAGKYEDLYLAWQLDDLEIDIVENPTVNRGKRGDYMTGQDVSMRVFDVLCPMTGEKEGEFCPMSYQQGEDEGLLVNKCTFKTLVYGDHGDTPTPDEPVTFKFVKLLDEPPADGVQLKDGWMWKQGGKMYLCAGQEIKVLGGVQEDEMSSYVESQVSSKADLSVFENECWKKDDAVISAELGFTTQGFNSVSDDWGEDFLFGSGAAIANYNSSGALILEDRRVTSQAIYDTAIITSRGIKQISKSGDGEPVIHGTLMFPRNDSEFTNLATEKWVEGQISAKADLSALDGKADLSSLDGKADLSALPSKTSQLTNDSGFITSAQVEPSNESSTIGYAKNSKYATQLKALDLNGGGYTDRCTFIPATSYDAATNTYTLELRGSVGGYHPWNLHRLFGTDFSPMITLEWRKGSIYRKRVMGSTVRWSVVYNNNWMWLAKGQYAITCPTGDGNPNGKFYVLNYEDETHPNYINDPATDVHTITYNRNEITTIDGQAGGEQSQAIWCHRINDNNIAIWERPLAYRDELSSKADLSALDVKADLSALASYLPLSGGTLSGTLNVQSVYGSQFTSNSECQTGGGQTYASFGNNGILMGRSPNLLRVLWPFDTDLGNNQTFATQEWVDVQM